MPLARQLSSVRAVPDGVSRLRTVDNAPIAESPFLMEILVSTSLHPPQEIRPMLCPGCLRPDKCMLTWEMTRKKKEGTS